MASQHIVTSFEDDLQGLARSIAEMGGRAEQIVERVDHRAASRPTRTSPTRSSRPTSRSTRCTARSRRAPILVIARRQPMAQDLRETIAAIRIANDSSASATSARTSPSARVAIQNETFSQKVRVGVEHLAELGLRQVKKVLDAYATRDVEKAREVCAQDQEIDAVYTSLFRELLTYMMEDPRNITMCTHLLFCAKNIERIGDHATNIAETVFYLITGEQWDEPRQSSTRVDD